MKTRPRFFGQYLLANGLVTASQLLAAAEYQDRNNSRLGDYAVNLGLATRFEIEQVRALQATEDRLFGDAAVKLGILTDDQVQQILRAQKDQHVRLGDALVELGHLDKIQVDQALAEFFDAEDKLEPEVVTIPPGLPGEEIAFELFYLAHKLLTRVCGLANKTEALKIREGLLELSGRNVRSFSQGGYQGYVLLCVPDAVAEALAARSCGELEPTEDDVKGAALDLCRLLCGNLRSVLAERGQRIELSEPEPLENQLSLSPGEKVALVPFLTHEGPVLVGMRLA